MKSILALGLVAAVVAVGVAAAEPVVIDGSPAGLGTYYVNDADASVWEESNGCAGLQTAESDDCGPADTRVL